MKSTLPASEHQHDRHAPATHAAHSSGGHERHGSSSRAGEEHASAHDRHEGHTPMFFAARATRRSQTGRAPTQARREGRLRSSRGRWSGSAPRIEACCMPGCACPVHGTPVALERPFRCLFRIGQRCLAPTAWPPLTCNRLKSRTGKNGPVLVRIEADWPCGRLKLAASDRHEAAHFLTIRG